MAELFRDASEQPELVRRYFEVLGQRIQWAGTTLAAGTALDGAADALRAWNRQRGVPAELPWRAEWDARAKANALARELRAATGGG
jgi:hypothetical protein